MENENDLKKPATKDTEQSNDPGANIETVTPSTEELVPETPVADNDKKEDSKPLQETKEQHSEDEGNEDEANNIETVSP